MRIQVGDSVRVGTAWYIVGGMDAVDDKWILYLEGDDGDWDQITCTFVDEVRPAPRRQGKDGRAMNNSQLESFGAAARPLIKWLCENGHPHHAVMVTCTGAELLEGEFSTGEIMDYVQD